MTLTYPALDRARESCGSSPGPRRSTCCGGSARRDPSIPAGRVAAADQRVSLRPRPRQLRAHRAPFHVVAPSDQHLGGQRRREQPVRDQPGRRVQASRERRRVVSPLEVCDDTAIGAGRNVAKGQVAELVEVVQRRASPKPSAPAEPGRGSDRRSCRRSTMTTNRSAADATRFSRVCAAPPPFTIHPASSTWSAPSIAMSRWSRAPAPSNGSTCSPRPRACRLVATDVATHRRSSPRAARAGSMYATVDPVPRPTSIPV